MPMKATSTHILADAYARICACMGLLNYHSLPMARTGRVGEK